MKRVEYTDDTGRRWITELPYGKEHEPANFGIPVGPPDTSGLGFPEEVVVRLHNQLVNRGLLTKKDLHGRTKELFAALQAAYKVDVVKLIALYQQEEV